MWFFSMILSQSSEFTAEKWEKVVAAAEGRRHNFLGGQRPPSHFSPVNSEIIEKNDIFLQILIICEKLPSAQFYQTL